jgi:hypothetical protein
MGLLVESAEIDKNPTDTSLLLSRISCCQTGIVYDDGSNCKPKDA